MALTGPAKACGYLDFEIVEKSSSEKQNPQLRSINFI